MRKSVTFHTLYLVYSTKWGAMYGEQLELMSESEKEVRKIVGPIEERIAAAIRRGWARWRNLPAEDRLILSNGRTMSSIVWSYMVNEVEAVLDGERGVTITRKHNTVNFNIKNKILFRIKKLTRGGRSRNYPTPTALAYYAQIEIDGMPKALRIDIGYVRNRTASDIEQIMVSYRSGDNVAWSYVIEEPAVKGAIGDITPDEGKKEEKRPRRVRVRDGKSKVIPLEKGGTSSDG